MPRSRKVLVTVTAAGLLLGVVGLARAAGPTLEDPRLQPVRARIDGAMEQTRRAGLPAELVNGKIREGLAKGAPADAIATAAERLASNLAEADRVLLAQRPGGRSMALVRALAEARSAGVELQHAAALTRPRTPEAQAVRAVEALTELARRGYPSATAALLVREMLDRDPGSVPRLTSGLEAVRNARGLSRADALALVRAGVAGGASTLEAALDSTRGDDSQGDQGNRGNGEKKEKPVKTHP